MKSLADHLHKYTKIGSQQKGDREVCADVLSTLLHTTIPVTAVRVRNEILEITVPAPLKTKVREMKREILLTLRKRLGDRVRDVV
jgi:hypothetical protein